jgi:hypothetical protein
VQSLKIQVDILRRFELLVVADGTLIVSPSRELEEVVNLRLFGLTQG